jgi:hypothetical protein
VFGAMSVGSPLVGSPENLLSPSKGYFVGNTAPGG